MDETTGTESTYGRGEKFIKVLVEAPEEKRYTRRIDNNIKMDLPELEYECVNRINERIICVNRS
jgi:hypothetical protein